MDIKAVLILLLELVLVIIEIIRKALNRKE